MRMGKRPVQQQKWCLARRPSPIQEVELQAIDLAIPVRGRLRVRDDDTLPPRRSNRGRKQRAIRGARRIGHISTIDEPMRAQPTDLPDSEIAHALREAWAWSVEATEPHYVAVGGGSHHWRIDGQAWL